MPLKNGNSEQASEYPEATLGNIPRDITSSSHAGQKAHMVTVPNVKVTVHVPQSSIPGQQTGIGAASSIHVFSCPIPCITVDSIHIYDQVCLAMCHKS